MSSRNRRECVCFFALTLFFLSILATPSFALPPCITASTLNINTTLRHPGTNFSENFSLTLGESGVLVLETSTTHPEQPRRTVQLLSHSCVTNGALNPALLYQTPTELVLRIDGPGLVYFTVEPEDPNATPAPFKLRSTFVTDPQGTPALVQPATEPPSSCTDTDPPTVDFMGAVQTAQVEEDTDPWDCDIISGNFPSGILLIGGAGTALETSLYADQGCQHRITEGILLGDPASVIAAPIFEGEHRLMVGSVQTSGAYTLNLDHFPVCLYGEQDDHSDSFFCASRLDFGSTQQGIVDNLSGDDEDAFFFRLDDQKTVEIDLQAGSETFCLLFDDRGQRLTAWQECGTNPLRKTLGRGTYRLKVIGGLSNAAYDLTLGQVIAS